MPGFVMSLPAGRLVTDEDALPKRKFLNSEFYTDWVRPQGMYTCLYVNAFRDKDCAAYLCLTREQGTRAFLRKDMARLRQILPHLGRAAEIHFRLAEAARQRGLSREVISLTAQEVICVDVHGRTAFASPRAELRLREADGLAENSMGLRASTEGDTRRLRRQITQGFALPDGARHSSTLKLPRRNGKKPLSVTIIPAASNGSAEHVVLLVADPDVPTPTCAQLLRQRYHLTAAEIRVTEMILAGHELRTVAALLDVSLGTVRNQLKSIFQKTDTHRQSALVRLLLRDCLLGPRAP
jgi:DNA-binding CsgD family transcriptional regulator